MSARIMGVNRSPRPAASKPPQGGRGAPGSSLPVPIAEVDPGATSLIKLTSVKPKPDPVGVRDAERVNKTGARIRAQILLLVHKLGLPTQREVQGILGLASPGALAKHLVRLRSQGFLTSGGCLRLTDAGRHTAEMLSAMDSADSAFRQHIRKVFGCYRHAYARAVHQAATLADGQYNRSRAGLTRRLGGSVELERKVSSMDCLRALKQTGSVEEAARLVGLHSGAYHGRVAHIFGKAKKLLQSAAAEVPSSSAPPPHTADEEGCAPLPGGG